MEGWFGRWEGKNVYAVSREAYSLLEKRGWVEKFAIYWFNDVGTLVCNGMVIGRMRYAPEEEGVNPFKIEYVRQFPLEDLDKRWDEATY